MLHHIYRSNIGVLSYGQYAFQRYFFSKQPKTTRGAPIGRSIISKYIHQPQDASRSLNNPLFQTPSSTVRYKSDTTTDRPVCSHPGCKALAKTRGLCNTHAYPCSVEGCEKGAIKAGGYCRLDEDAYDAHAKQYSPDDHKKLLSQYKRCKVIDCEKYVQADGYCVEHAEKHAPEAHRKYRDKENKRFRDRRKTDPQFKLGERIKKYVTQALKELANQKRAS